MLDLATFPYVLRSDNAPEFVSDVIRWMNAELGIRHVTSSTYHPQSQGVVERMHRTLNEIVTKMVQDHPGDWETKLKYAQFVLRTAPMKVLGDRSPYEVVTGLRPSMPAMLNYGHIVRAEAPTECVKDLVEAIKVIHKDVQRLSLIHI